MGHYLAEMEDDGVPRAFKVGIPSGPTQPDKYSIMKCVCTKQKVERLFGVELTWAQVDAYLDAMEARKPAMMALQADFDRKAREVFRDALSSVVGEGIAADPSPALSREGRGE